jgi:hypothetical protein
MAINYKIQQRTTPAKCRSKNLQLAGIKPSEAVGLCKRVQIASQRGIMQLSNTWSYQAGNDPAHSVIVDRGVWDPANLTSTPYYYQSYNPDTTLYEWHYAWYYGARWKCKRDATNLSIQPNRFDWDFEFSWNDILIGLRLSTSSTRYTITAYLRNNITGEDLEIQDNTPFRVSWRLERSDGNTDADTKWENSRKLIKTVNRQTISKTYLGDSESLVVSFVVVPTGLTSTVNVAALRDTNGDYMYDANGKIILHQFKEELTELKVSVTLK